MSIKNRFRLLNNLIDKIEKGVQMQNQSYDQFITKNDHGMRITPNYQERFKTISRKIGSNNLKIEYCKKLSQGFKQLYETLIHVDTVPFKDNQDISLIHQKMDSKLILLEGSLYPIHLGLKTYQDRGFDSRVPIFEYFICQDFRAPNWTFTNMVNWIEHLFNIVE